MTRGNRLNQRRQSYEKGRPEMVVPRTGKKVQQRMERRKAWGYIHYWRIKEVEPNHKQAPQPKNRDTKSKQYLNQVEVRRSNQPQYSQSELEEKLTTLEKQWGNQMHNTVNKDNKGNLKRMLVVRLRYTNGVPAIKQLVQVSTSGRDIYSDCATLWSVHHRRGMYIVSNTKGLMSDKQATQKGRGGKVRFYIF